MSLQVLSDTNVRSLLAGLTLARLQGLFDVLGGALQTYSTGQEKSFQCHRQGVTRPGQATMLFMPATLPDGCSVKVVGVPQATAAALAKPKELTGVVLICDADGRAEGVLNGAALTAFRTALGSMLAYRHRRATENIVVFGAGKQAYWHVRLALLQRRADIRRVTVVNRSAARAEDLVREWKTAPIGELENDWDTSHIDFSVVVGTTTAEVVQQADVIFSGVPSHEPLFPAEWLTCEAARQKTRLVAAIGSYKLDMQELDPALLRAAASDRLPGGYWRDPADKTRTTLLVDSRDACAVEAGELVQAGLPDAQLWEMGELLRFAEAAEGAEKQRLLAWLQDGNVIYKSVGIGIMDLCIGRALLEMGASLGVGTAVEGF